MEIFEAAKKGEAREVVKLLDTILMLEAKKRYLFTALEVAAQHGQLEVVKTLLPRGDELCGLKARPGLALHLAAKHGHETVVDFLLKSQAPAGSDALGKRTPLMWASSEGHVGVAQRLLDHTGGKGVNDGDTEEGRTALHYAAASGHQEVVSLLLSHGADATKKDKEGRTALSSASEMGHLGVARILLDRQGGQCQGLQRQTSPAMIMERTPLHFAASKGQEEMVRFLLDKGANAGICGGQEGLRPLMEASRNGHVGVARILLEHMTMMGWQGVVNTRDKEGRTALYHAAVNGQEEVVGFLLGKGADPTIKGFRDGTSLTGALANGHVEVAWMLLKHMITAGQGVDTRDNGGRTALFLAACLDDEVFVAFLLSKGANAEIQTHSGATPLMEASNSGHVGLARMLLEHSAMGWQSVNTRDKEGWTALYHAAVNGHKEVVEFLLSKGADPTIKDADGWTPLIGALAECHVEVAWMLLRHMITAGQDVNTRDNGGRTALFYAACLDDEDFVAFLLSKGANADIKDHDDQTALMEASREGHIGVARVLLKHMRGQSVNTRDNEGWTALHHAAFEGHQEMVTLLLASGADASSTTLRGKTALALATEESHWDVVALLAKHMGPHALEERDTHGRTPLHLACVREDGLGARKLLLAGADHTTRDNMGRGLRGDVATILLPWWEGELERRYLPHRARHIQDAGSAMRLPQTSHLPPFLQARLAATRPRVEIVSAPQEEHTVPSGKRSGVPLEGQPVEEEERVAMLRHVVTGLNDQLFVDLLQALHAPRAKA